MRHPHALLAAWVVAACGASPPPRATPGASSISSSRSAPRPAPSATSVPSAGPRTPADEIAEARVGAMLARVASARRLEAHTRVPSHVLDRGALLEKVREHVRREIPARAIKDEGELLVALGVVPPEFDYETATFALLETQLAGFYEPADGAMYLAADLDEDAAAATLSHELVHALQDRHFHLGDRMTYRAGESDATAAVQSLAEGDATSAMMDVLLAPRDASALSIPDRAFRAQVEASMIATTDPATTPATLRDSLVAPYLDGISFVHALRRRGGWAEVDRAWAHPPDTTEQLLHVTKYDAREPAERLAPPSSPATDDWERLHDDVVGEQGMRILFSAWAPSSDAAAAAAGWGGDRVALFESRSEPRRYAAALHVRFDAAARGPRDADAIEAANAVAAGWHATPTGPAGVACAPRAAPGGLALARRGRDLWLVAGPHAPGSPARPPPPERCEQLGAWLTEQMRIGDAPK